MRSSAFWEYFDTVARPRLGLRAGGFAQIFEHLDRFDRPVGIVEAGCMRRPEGALAGDGGSTVLFDRYAAFHPGSTVHSVDIDAAAVSLCRQMVSPLVTVAARDSVAFLSAFAAAPPAGFPALDLLFLDSTEADRKGSEASALQHLKEVMAALPLVGAESLVVVDDSPTAFLGVRKADGSVALVGTPGVGGKGRLVAEYAQHVGAALHIQGYQAGWLGLRGAGRVAVGEGVSAHAVISASAQGVFATGIEDAFVGRSLRETGRYGQAEIEQAAGFISPSDNVLVVGAHIGAIAIPLARRCRHLTAIEANPWTYKLLQCNVLLNDADNVQAHHFAASDAAGTIRFVMNTQNSGGSKRYPVKPEAMYFHDNPEVVEVPSFALDEKLGRHDFALVFMDIEGSEYFALRGMTRILEFARCLIVEFLPHHLTNVAGVTPEAFVQLLEPHFARMFVPSLGQTVGREAISGTLRQMFDRGRGDEGLVFTK